MQFSGGTIPFELIILVIIVTTIIIGISLKLRQRRLVFRPENMDQIYASQSNETRQTIITKMFEDKMQAIGLEPSKDSGYRPTSHTPLVRYLREYGISDDVIDAIMTGLDEEGSVDNIREIIEDLREGPTHFGTRCPRCGAHSRRVGFESIENHERKMFQCKVCFTMFHTD